MPRFQDFDLDQTLLNTLEQIGYSTPTPIQALAIPQILKGNDLLASAQTGTGKTAAFMLPLLHRLITNSRKGKTKSPRIVILVPTRELAIQIAKTAEKYSSSLERIKTVCIYGGVPYPIQRRALSRPYEILVATPGRLIDHLEQKTIDLSTTEAFVLDEADRMLDMGFIEPVERIASEMPKQRQTLLFSATFDKKIIRLSKQLQNDPEEIRIEPETLANKNIEQRVYYTDNYGHKMQILDHVLQKGDVYQAIIFTSTIRNVEDLAEELCNKGHKVGTLHGDMQQRQRTRMINQLRDGKIHLLVATDVAARGIDITSITHVINVDLPFQAEDYVHRIGRTARGAETGMAISFASLKERDKLSKIEKLLGSPITAHTVPGLEPTQKKKRPSFPNKQKPRQFGKRKKPTFRKKSPANLF